MPFYTLTFKYSDTVPVCLNEFLMNKLPTELERVKEYFSISKTKVRRLIIAGAVTVNGKQTRKAMLLIQKGNKIVVRLNTEKFLHEKQPDDIAFELTPARILFEDESIIVVDKPAGLPTEQTIVQTRDHLQAAVSRFLVVRDGTENPYVGIHHRLDRDTSGVILFTKQRKFNAAVHHMFLEQEVHKQYEALVSRPLMLPKSSFSVDNFLGRISPKSAPGKWGAVKQGGDLAHTDFRVLKEYRKGLHILAMPITGRTHQIRVHLASLRMPLLGDSLYGGLTELGGYKIPRIMLHAVSIKFPHPADGREMIINAPIPEDFQSCLDIL